MATARAQPPRFVILSLLAAVGCTDRIQIDLEYEGAASMVIAVEVGGDRSLVAVDNPLTDPAVLLADPEYDPSRPTRVTVFRYTVDLLALGLTEGPLEATEQPSFVRPLPGGAQIAIAEVSDGELGPWSEALGVPGTLADLRFAPSLGIACAELGGCVVEREEGEPSLVCASPCPAPTPIEPPAPPLPPRFRPCPDGWLDVQTASTSVCAPAEPSDLAGCPADRVLRPGAGCVAVGSPCPIGAFSDDAPLGALYVQSGATGGNGSAAAPFSTIAEAIMALGPTGGTVALSKGTHTVAALPSAFRLLGACAEQTSLSDGVSLGSNSALRDLRVPQIIANAAVDTDLTGVIVGPGPAPVQIVRGSSVTMTDVVVSSEAGNALNITRSTLSANAVELVGAPSIVVAEMSSSEVTLTDFSIRVRRRSTALSPGLRSLATELILRRGVILGGTGDVIALNGGSLDAVDLVIRDGEAMDPASAAVQLQNAEVRIERLWVDRMAGAGLKLSRTMATLSDVVFTAVGGPGAQINATSGSLERAVIDRRIKRGVDVGGLDSVVSLSDLRVGSADATNANAADDGIGLRINGATVQLVRATFVEQRRSGISIASLGGKLVADDLRVSSTRFGLTGVRGDGITIAGVGEVHLTRARIEDSERTGLSIGEEALVPALVTGEDFEVRGSLEGCDALECPVSVGGTGVSVWGDSNIDLRRFRLSNNALAGLAIVQGEALLVDGAVDDNAIGLSVPDFDDRAMARRVRYSGNCTLLGDDMACVAR